MKEIEYCPLETIIRDEKDKKKIIVYTFFSNIGDPQFKWETYVSGEDEQGYLKWLETAYNKTYKEALSYHMSFVRKYSE
ncbi:hypothetical protein IKF67_03080 [Candidatus Saccharibacteria bacterium]|nr:hypothetical protein [Candidatus Saccharibacteria bacterium]